MHCNFVLLWLVKVYIARSRYNAPACFFFGTDFQEQYFKAREDRLVAHNESTKAWKAEGRRRCLDHLFSDGSGGFSLFLGIRVADTARSFPVIRMHALTPLTIGDLIPDVFTELTDEGLEWPAPLRMVNTEPFDLSALEVRSTLLSLRCEILHSTQRIRGRPHRRKWGQMRFLRWTYFRRLGLAATASARVSQRVAVSRSTRCAQR